MEWFCQQTVVFCFNPLLAAKGAAPLVLLSCNWTIQVTLPSIRVNPSGLVLHLLRTDAISCSCSFSFSSSSSYRHFLASPHFSSSFFHFPEDTRFTSIFLRLSIRRRLLLSFNSTAASDAGPQGLTSQISRFSFGIIDAKPIGLL